LVDQYLKYTYPYSLEERIQRIQREVKKRNLDGLVHYTQSFCFHQTEHAMLKSALDIPVLQLEGHEPNQLDGRSRTRLGAFLESFSKKKGNTMNSKICAGLDIGSRSVKVVLSKNGKITKFSRPTSEFYRAFLTAEEKSFSRSFLMDIFPELAGVEQLTVTGYGREKVNWPGAKEITEVLAHALGAMDSSGLADFILVDIGGQDTKIIRVEGGCLTDFELNDRCAAGSGRFMENMAAILNLTMDELDSYDVEPVHLDATCATFGETELVGQILSGASLPALATGVIQAVYERLLPVVRRMEGQNLLLSGGGARIKRLAKLFESGTGMKVITLKEPQYTGALGCLHNSLQQLA
jgi:predicted CoA-substrate-specific enzyme activase